VEQDGTTELPAATSSEPNSNSAVTKRRTDLVRRLALANKPLTGDQADVVRFWVLYRRDLIGIESAAFPRIMVAIGEVLNSLTASQSLPNGTLWVWRRGLTWWR
jgi:hypothetical protein